jgi:POT family proton-dependent oligopeptide transporter
MFFWVNTALTIGPLAAVTFVLFRLFGATFARIPFSNAAIGLSFAIIWFIAIWMLNKEYNMKAYEVNFTLNVVEEDEKTGEKTSTLTDFTKTVQSDDALSPNDEIFLIDLESKQGSGKLKIIDEEKAQQFETDFTATVVRELQNETEVPASWFGILNSFFIIAFAPLFTMVWESKLNPSAPVKFGLGLVLLGMGFGVLAIGSMGIEEGAKSASASMWWLILAYLFHTLGELCVSPVGLSYVSKLAPMRLVGLMFGVWFGATAIANYLAGWSGSFIDKISDEYGLVTFFLIYTIIPVAAGVVMWSLNGMIKRKMHGIA